MQYFRLGAGIASGLAILALFVGHASAANCYQYTSAETPPTGFGAAFSIIDGAQLLKGNCTANDVTIEVNNSRQILLHPQGYVWSNGGWSPISFSGSRVGESWLSGGTANYSFGTGNSLNVVAYICEKDGTWKCGCRSGTQCSGSNGAFYWNFQKFSKPVAAAPEPRLTFSVTPTSITGVGSATLNWDSNADSCTASGGWSGTKAASGSQSVSVAQTTTYTVTCGTLSRSQTVTITTPPPVGDDDDTVTVGCTGTLKDLPASADSVGQCYRSPKIPYTDQAQGRQGYRLTTWGKTLGKNITLGHTGAQETTQWSNDSSKVTFTMSYSSAIGTQNAAVFVLDIPSEKIKLVSKNALNRGSAFNKANPNEVLYWKVISDGLELTAVNIETLSQRKIITLTGAKDAGTPAQSFDAQGRYIHTWVTGRGGGNAHVQSVVIDTRPNGGGGAQVHPAFPFDPDLVVTLPANGHDLYRDSALWNPVFTNKAIIIQRSPLSNLGPSGAKNVLYDFSTNTAVNLAGWWPAHSSWSADGKYWITNFGLIDINKNCLDADGNCAVSSNNGAVYGLTGLAYGRLETAEQNRGMNQRFIVHPYNGRLQELTLNTFANVPTSQWKGDADYTIGYSFATEAGDGLKLADIRRQYSPNGKWLMWRSNLQQKSLQTPPGPDDNNKQSTDIFILDAR